ncbi:hypothetical protein, partial [Bacillus sp. AFS019443]|uniref:hypothetical protein n=1 Tax=Bacillus sp. AFS019443 TaxID=2034279 RepID=UPI000BFABBCF
KQSGPFSATCEVKTERAKECRLLFILHSRDLDVEKLKWIYIVKGASFFGRGPFYYIFLWNEEGVWK